MAIPVKSLRNIQIVTFRPLSNPNVVYAWPRALAQKLPDDAIPNFIRHYETPAKKSAATEK